MRFHAERIYRWYIPSYIKNLEQAIVRKSHRRCSMKKCVLKNLATLQESTCVIVSFLIKLRLIPATSSRKRLWHRCFSVNFAKKFKKFFFTEPLQVATSALWALGISKNFSSNQEIWSTTIFFFKSFFYFKKKH